MLRIIYESRTRVRNGMRDHPVFITSLVARSCCYIVSETDGIPFLGIRVEFSAKVQGFPCKL